MIQRVLLASAALVLVSCRGATLPDPNDPKDVGIVSASVLRSNLKATSDMLNQRVLRGEISDEQRRSLIQRRAADLLRDVELERVDKAEAWGYAEVYRTAQKWQQAAELYRIAVEAAESSDRKVNDTLHLAECVAHLDKGDEAIRLVRSVFSVPAQDKAPILPAVLFEIVPPLRQSGKPAEVAKLLEDAIGQHAEVIVDPKSEGGQLFFEARPHLVKRAWMATVELYLEAGRTDDAERARKKGAHMAASAADV